MLSLARLRTQSAGSPTSSIAANSPKHLLEDDYESIEFVISVFFAPTLENLADVRLPLTATIRELAETVALMSERCQFVAFPCCPRLLNGLEQLDFSHTLVDAGLTDGSFLVADMFPCMITASKDGAARIWNAETGECEKILLGHTAPVNFACIGPDCRFAATASDDKTSKIWGCVQGKCWRTLLGHSDQVNCVAFSPNGKLIVTGSSDRTAKVWSTKNGICLQTLRGHTDSVYMVAFMNADSVITWSQDKTAKQWNASTGICDRTLLSHEPAYSASFAADGKLVLTTPGDRAAYLNNVATGDVEMIFRGHEDLVVSAQFGPAPGPMINPHGNAIWRAASPRANAEGKGLAASLRLAAEM